MKERTEKEYFKVPAALQSKLYGGNVINTWAVATSIIGARIINWAVEDLERINRKTRKLIKNACRIVPQI